MTLHLGTNLAVPDDAVTQTFAIFGKRGSGKSNGGTVLAEEMFKAHLPFVVLDPVDAWWGLKASFDGKAAGLGVYIFGGPHGDLPLDTGAGALIADMIIKHRISVVLSFKGWTGADRTRFASDFAARLLAKNTTPLHVFLEEADAFIPQRPQRGEETMLGNFDRMVRWGRQSGIGCTLITQRSAKVNKDVTTQAETLISFRVIGPQDRDAIDNWIKFHASEEQRQEVLSTIATLKDGQAWVWSPEWLEVLRIVSFRRRQTYDSAATPKVGEKRPTPKRLASVDLERLRDQMAASIEQARQSDPRVLNGIIRDLRRELAARPAPEPQVREVKVEVIPAVLTDVLMDLATDMVVVAARIDEMGKRLDRVKRLAAKAPIGARTQVVREAQRQAPEPVTAIMVSRRSESRPTSLGGGAQRILNTLAWLESVGIQQAERTQVAALSDLAPRAGTFGTYLSRLQSSGLITYSGKIVKLTDEGRDYADAQAAPQTTDELHRQVFAKLGGGMERILRVLIAAYPREVERTYLADKARLTSNAGTFGTYLSRLRSLGFINVDRNVVKANDVLFIGG